MIPKRINGVAIDWEHVTIAAEPEPPRCPRCDAAINVERVGVRMFVSDCCGKPFRWPPKG